MLSAVANPIGRAVALLVNQREIAVLAALGASIGMLVLPLPGAALDGLIALNFFFAMLLLLLTVRVVSSTRISTFPSLLLISTIFRLALTVSTTRAILSTGDAGRIIHAFGAFVVGGSVSVGIVIFLVIGLVQIIVVTKGAERIGEVAARFSLDSMPGKQMSIEADVRANVINREDAILRRSELERESQFFGALDGAMKFVKGDAIAALVVAIINLIGGILVGVFVHHMKFAEALNNFSLLSVGDGLVAQIPSIVSSIAAGLLVTRVASKNDSLATEITRQITHDPRSLILASVMLLGLGLSPGFPFLIPSTLAALILGFMALTHREKLGHLVAALRGSSPSPTMTSETSSNEGPPKLPGERPNDPIVCRGCDATISALAKTQLRNTLESKLGELTNTLGLPLPRVSFSRQADVPEARLLLLLEGVEVELIGWKSSGPITSQTAAIDADAVADAIAAGVRDHVFRIIGIQEAGMWLSSLEVRYSETVAKIRARGDLQPLAVVMRELLREGLTLTHPRAILEAYATAKGDEVNPIKIVETVRQSKISHFVKTLATDGVIRILTISDKAGTSIRALLRGANSLATFKEGETRLNALKLGVEEAKLKHGPNIVLAVAPELRAAISQILLQQGVAIKVFSLNELRGATRLEVVDTINLDSEPATRASTVSSEGRAI